MGQVILQTLGELIGVLKNRRTLLVCGNSFDRLDIAKEFDQLDLVRFSGFSPNPLYEDVCKGIELFQTSGCDTILAVGGGSAIDVAKCIKLFCRMDPSVNYLKQAYSDSGILLAAIPTTAGTGSESTRHAVIYFQGVKQSVSHVSVIPDDICLIPSVLKNLPVYQKKCTMLDALCQAIESWWSVSSTAESIAYSRRAIGLIRDHWEAYLQGDTEAADGQILLAANLAGKAINITATTAAHAMSYKLTSLFGLPHGHAAALCLPEVWEYMLREDAVCSDPRGRSHLDSVLAELPVDSSWFRELLNTLDMHYPVSTQKEADLNTLTRSVNPERLKNNPVLLDENTLRAMYERILQ